jgi:N-acetylglucosamine-6-phosphate deacetylase
LYTINSDLKKEGKTMKGYVDIHTHGLGRYDTRTVNPRHIIRIAKMHAEAGTSAILPTVYSDTIPHMRINMQAIKQAMTDQNKRFKIQDAGSRTCLPAGRFKISKRASDIMQRESCILGVHLEGPFLNPDKCGAQRKKTFLKPSVSALLKLVKDYEDIIKIITIAPELPGALKVIEKCVSLGIKVNMGHSAATHRQALEGKNAGAGGISHIFNAMIPLHHREPGLIGFGLLDEDIYIEVIADKIHVDENVLNLIFRTKRLDRIILVTDSVKGAKDNKGRIFASKGVLAGSSITLSDAVKNIIDIGISKAIALETAIDNPKRYLNLI